MNNFPYFHLIPEDCSTLTKIRLGYRGDGGYCIPQEILKDIKTVVTFGVNDEDSFERALQEKLVKKATFYLCDPFCQYTKRPGNEEFHFMPIGLDGVTSEEKRMISWRDFRGKNLGVKENIFLKVDIEFAEWDSFENLEFADFEGVEILVIEFHSLLSRFDTVDKQTKVLKLLKDQYHLYHLHANNNGYVFTNDTLGYLPDVIECTFIKKTWASSNGHTFVKRQQEYPEEIDVPCHETKYDPVIHWWKSMGASSN